MRPLTGPEGSAFFRVAEPEDIRQSVSVNVTDSLTFEQQAQYKYILDMDGGLGSSRVQGLFGSGSVPFLADSDWFLNFSTLLKAWVHYVPVSHDLLDLYDKLEYARSHDDHMRWIVQNAIGFKRKYLSREASKVQLRMQLQMYNALQAPDVRLDSSNVEVDFCSTNDAGVT